jgi:hypothetical protein
MKIGLSSARISASPNRGRIVRLIPDWRRLKNNKRRERAAMMALGMAAINRSVINEVCIFACITRVQSRSPVSGERREAYLTLGPEARCFPEFRRIRGFGDFVCSRRNGATGCSLKFDARSCQTSYRNRHDHFGAFRSPLAKCVQAELSGTCCNLLRIEADEAAVGEVTGEAGAEVAKEGLSIHSRRLGWVNCPFVSVEAAPQQIVRFAS